MKVEELRNRIAFNFRRIRKAKNLDKQAEVGELASVSQGYIGGVETGNKSFGMRSQLKWAEIFEIDVCEFFLPEDLSIEDFEWLRENKIEEHEKDLISLIRSLDSEAMEELTIALTGLIDGSQKKQTGFVKRIKTAWKTG